MKLIILIVSVVLTACSSAYSKSDTASVPSLVSKFDQLAQQYLPRWSGITSRVVVKKMPASSVGACDLIAHIATVDSLAWANANEWGREALLFHVLGTCELGRSPDARKLSDGAPASIMNPTGLPWKLLAADPNGYERELFTSSGQGIDK